MFENLINFFKNIGKKDKVKDKETSDTAKERLHLVLMQDRANVSADFLELMKQEIIEVIKKYIDIDEKSIDVHLTNKSNEDGTTGAPALYANIPIVNIKKDKEKIVSERKESLENKSEKESIEKENNNVDKEKQEIKEEKEKTTENNEETKKQNEQRDNNENEEKVKDVKENKTEESTKEEETKKQNNSNAEK